MEVYVPEDQIDDAAYVLLANEVEDATALPEPVTPRDRSVIAASPRWCSSRSWSPRSRRWRATSPAERPGSGEQGLELVALDAAERAVGSGAVEQRDLELAGRERLVVAGEHLGAELHRVGEARPGSA